MHRFFVIELISVTASTVVRCCCFRRWDMGDANGIEEVKDGTEKNAYLVAALCLIKLNKKGDRFWNYGQSLQLPRSDTVE